MHVFAYLVLGRYADCPAIDAHALVVITGTLVLAADDLSQAMESVTRAFYARGDLDLILTSPATTGTVCRAHRGDGVTILFMTLVLGAPFINVLVWLGGAHWLGAYGCRSRMALGAALAVALRLRMFRAIGPRRTRVVAQIVAAVIGAAFVIGVQFAAILSFGTISRMAVLQSASLALAPDVRQPVWWPARAVLGEPSAMVVLVGLTLRCAGGRDCRSRRASATRDSPPPVFRASPRPRRRPAGSATRLPPRHCATRNGRCCGATPG